MNNVFTAKLLQSLRNKKGEKGFTLIELLVVVIIIGVLAAVALPNLLGQVAKGRQSEARNVLGTVNRTQQAHRLEFGTFGELGDFYLNGNIALPGKIGLDPATLTDADGDGAADNQLAVSMQPEFYQFTDARDASNLTELTSVPVGDPISATFFEAYAVANAQFDNDVLDYASMVTQDTNGNFASIICEEPRLNATNNGALGPVANGNATTLATACAAGNQVN